MANRRMFSLKVVDTDAFCDMPTSTQNLYFQIGMRADDDGLCASVKGIMSKIHCGEDDLNVLLARGFILDRGEGVYLIKHWKLNNYLQSDRYTATEYPEKLEGVYLKNNGVYTLDESQGKPLLQSNKTKCIQNVYTGKDSIVKDSKEKNSIDNKEKDSILKENDFAIDPETNEPLPF